MFKAADKLRGNMEPSDYKHVAFGLIFLKHISDSFEAKRAELLASVPTEPMTPTSIPLENGFLGFRKEARWSHLQANAKQPSIGKLIDEAMIAIEKRNETLKGVLPKDYARPALQRGRGWRTNRADFRNCTRPGKRRGKRATFSVASTTTSLASWPDQKASAVANSIRRVQVVRVMIGDDRALQRTRLRSMLRIERHGRPARESSASRARGADRRRRRL